VDCDALVDLIGSVSNTLPEEFNAAS